MGYISYIYILFIMLVFSFQPDSETGEVEKGDAVQQLYENCELIEHIDYEVFERAFKGYLDIDYSGKEIITIIDYTKPSTSYRMFIIDIKNEKLIRSGLVAHGKNTGENLATCFSNKKQSLQSSPGFYLTAETYNGNHGYSLRLDGLEDGINDLARERAIVLHGADYVSESFIKKHGRLGRSWGCPAVPDKEAKYIIDLIKEGSLLYIHTDDSNYLQNSQIR